MGSSGGGSSGKVEYPAYLQTMHGKMMDSAATDVLNVSMFDMLNAATTTNPFSDSTLVPYTGRAVIDNNGVVSMITAAAALNAVIASLTSTSVFDDFHTNLPLVKADIDATVMNDAIVTQASQAFDAVIAPSISEEKTKYDTDAVLLGIAMASSYTQGKTMIEARRIERVGTYDAELRSRMYLQRNDMIVLTTRELGARKLQNIQVTTETYKFACEVMKLKILNEREYFDANAKYLHDKATWNFEAMQYGFNGMSAIGGGSSLPKAGMSKAASTISGVLVGAAAGAYVGSVVPGVGTAIGAVAGGVIGGIGGMLG